MAWTLNGIRIFVQKDGETGKQIIARLQPLNGTTINQIFGHEGRVEKIGCKVVGDTDMNSLRSLVSSGDSYSLHNYEGTIGNFFVADLQKDREQCVFQNLREDLPENSPVYTVELTLYKDE